MNEENRHWSSDDYWTVALENYYRIRDGGTSKIELDLESLEGKIFDGDSPAYKMVDAMCSVKEHESWDGYKGAPRLVLALLALLHELESNA